MESTLDPIVTHIFMVELERSVIPCLAGRLNNLGRSDDDMIYFVKVDLINYVLSKLNSFHKKIQFTVEFEKEG